MRNLWLGLGSISCTYFLLVNLIGGRIYFSEIFLICGLIALGIGFKYEKIMSMDIVKNNMRFIKGFIFVCLGIFIIFEAIIIFYPKKNTEKSDLVVVLGAGIKGTTLSATLKSRLDATLEYIKDAKYDGYVLVSGGQGPDEDISEALAMKRYLVENGVNENQIVMEDRSTSTDENLKFSKDIIENTLNLKVDEINTKIITTDFHAFRSNTLAKHHGYENITLYTSGTRLDLIPNMYVREFFAFVKTVLSDILNVI